MDLSDYTSTDAIGLAELVAAGEVTPAELAVTAREAVEAVNHHVNAVAEIWEPEQEDLERDVTGSPLAGVPFLLKDIGVSMRGRRSELGSRLAEGLVAPEDSFLMRRFREAGLVTIGRTTTPEMALSAETESVLTGVTRNPWDTDRSAGGSSGGSAAAVAAGVVPAAHATDGAGSIRIPAAMTGLFGLKPSRGRVSSGPALDEALNGLGVQGVVSRSVRDSAALLDRAQGSEPGDPFRLPPPERSYLEEVDRDPGVLRIGVLAGQWGGQATSPAVATALEDAARELADLGHRVEVVPVGLGVSWEAFIRLNTEIWMTNLVPLVEGLAAATGRPVDASTLEHIALTGYEHGRRATAADLLRALDARNAVSRAVARHFTEHDLLLTPTLPDVAPPAGALHEGVEQLDAPGWVDRLFSASPFTPVFNITGQPAMSVPWTNEPETGLPIGIQFAAGSAREDVLLRLAGQLERTRPWRGRTPAVWAGHA